MKLLSLKASINVFLGLVFGIVLVFTKVILFFKSTRVAIIKKNAHNEEKAYINLYSSYLFMSKHNDGKSYYSNHQLIFNLMKDPLLAVTLVFCSKVPFVQIGVSLVVSLSFFILELLYTPSSIKSEN
jgi:hypothetical protein